MNDNTARDHDRPSPEKLRRIMAQINNMLAKADDPSCTPAEAEQNRQRAEVLMRRYRVEESELSAEDQAMLGIAVKRAQWVVCPFMSEFDRSYRSLLAYVVKHVEGEAVVRYDNGNLVAEVFGYESDLMYGERLFTSMRLAFQSRLEPQVDPALSDGENVYNLRNAGMERGRIGQAMGWGGEGTNGPGRVSRVYKAECKRRGEDANVLLGKGNNVKHFRADYAASFVEEIWGRLWRMRSAAGADSAALVMADRHDKVREALWEAYPQMRPTKAKQIGEPQAECPKCKKAASGYCREHQWMRPSRARRATRSTNWAAAERGAAAARSVDLGQGRSLDR